MKIKKKALSVLLVLGLMIGLMAGCSGTSEPSGTGGTSGGSDEKIELKLLHKWNTSGQGLEYFDESVKTFEDANPNVHFTVESVADEEIKSKLRVMMGAAAQPDIYFCWCGEFCYKFARAGQAYDMTDYLNKDSEWKDSFMPATLDSYTMDDHIYGIPFRLIGKLFVYNKKMWEEHNVKVPTTWDELMSACQTFKDAGITPIAFGNLDPWPACHYITGFNVACVKNDVRIKDYNYKTGEFTDPGYVKALGYLKEINDKGYFNEGVNSIKHDVASENFKAGKAAMFYCETGEFGGIIENGLEIGVFPMPELNAGGESGYIVGAPDGFMISPKTKHPEVCMEYLKLITSKEWQQKSIKELNYPSPVIGTHTSENTIQPLVDAMAYIEKAKGLANWLDTDVHTKVSDAYLPAMQEMLNGTLTPEQVMEKVQAAAQIVKTEEE